RRRAGAVVPAAVRRAAHAHRRVWHGDGRAVHRPRADRCGPRGLRSLCRAYALIRTLFFYVVPFVSTIVHGIAAILAGIVPANNRRVYDWCRDGCARRKLWAAVAAVDVQ